MKRPLGGIHRLLQALTLVALLLCASPLYAGPAGLCKPEGETPLVKGSACAAPGPAIATAALGHDGCAQPQTCGGGGIPALSGSCACPSGNRIRVAEFTTGMYESAPYVAERLGPMLGVLTTTPFNVICVNEVWVPEVKAIFNQILQLTGQYPSVYEAPVAKSSMLFSVLPFIETDYHQFQGPASDRAIIYAKIERGGQPIHVFCSDLTAGGRYPRWAQALNLWESLELINYIEAKADGGLAIFLGDTGSGPLLDSTDARWPFNFAVLQSHLTDLLLATSTAGCTHRCAGNPLSPANSQPRYVDHIMVSGPHCPVDAQVIFTQPIVTVPDAGPVPISTHYGVYADICLEP